MQECVGELMPSSCLPVPPRYDDFIQKNAGSSNAFTELVIGDMRIYRSFTSNNGVPLPLPLNLTLNLTMNYTGVYKLPL